MMQGVIIKGFGRKTGDKVNFVMMGVRPFARTSATALQLS